MPEETGPQIALEVAEPEQPKESEAGGSGLVLAVIGVAVVLIVVVVAVILSRRKKDRVDINEEPAGEDEELKTPTKKAQDVMNELDNENEKADFEDKPLCEKSENAVVEETQREPQTASESRKQQRN